MCSPCQRTDIFLLVCIAQRGGYNHTSAQGVVEMGVQRITEHEGWKRP